MLLSIKIKEIRRNEYFQSNFIDLFVYFLLITFALSFTYLTKSLTQPLATYHSLCSTYVTYGTTYHAVVTRYSSSPWEVVHIPLLNLRAIKRVLVGRFH